MELPTDQLSLKDRAFLERLRKSEIPIWRKPIGRLLVVVGFLMLTTYLVARLLHVFNHNPPLFFMGIIGILAGAIQLQQVRYQTIVRHLPIERDRQENGPVDPNADPLSQNALKLLVKLRKSKARFWRKAVGWLFVALAIAVLGLCLLAVLLDVGGGPFLLIGIILLLAGSIELQEDQYRRIIHRLLVETYAGQTEGVTPD